MFAIDSAVKKAIALFDTSKDTKHLEKMVELLQSHNELSHNSKLLQTRRLPDIEALAAKEVPKLSDWIHLDSALSEGDEEEPSRSFTPYERMEKRRKLSDDS